MTNDIEVMNNLRVKIKELHSERAKTLKEYDASLQALVDIATDLYNKNMSETVIKEFIIYSQKKTKCLHQNIYRWTTERESDHYYTTEVHHARCRDCGKDMVNYAEFGLNITLSEDELTALRKKLEPIEKVFHLEYDMRRFK
jgi:hypothetical protein